MTPKQKANELIYKMNGFTFEDCKNNAIICVKEILNVIEFMAESDEPDKLPYWTTVKEYIEKQLV
jgi:hypothetical protein